MFPHRKDIPVETGASLRSLGEKILSKWEKWNLTPSFCFLSRHRENEAIWTMY